MSHEAEFTTLCYHGTAWLVWLVRAQTLPAVLKPASEPYTPQYRDTRALRRSTEAGTAHGSDRDEVEKTSNCHNLVPKGNNQDESIMGTVDAWLVQYLQYKLSC